MDGCPPEPGARSVPAAAVRAAVPLPVSTPGGRRVAATMFSFDGLADGREHVAVGFPGGADEPLVRVHSECLTGDVLRSRRCDCGAQLDESLDALARQGGYLLYLRQEGRGIGLYAKLEAYRLQDEGLDTFAANRALGHPEDGRDYAVAAQMLAALGVRRVRLITNNPDKADQLRRLGVVIVEHVGTEVHLTPENHGYLRAKAVQHAHALDVAARPSPAAR